MSRQQGIFYPQTRNQVCQTQHMIHHPYIQTALASWRRGRIASIKDGGSACDRVTIDAIVYLYQYGDTLLGL